MFYFKSLLKRYMSALTFFSLTTINLSAMSHEESVYKVVKNTEVYEARLYAQRTVAQIDDSKGNNRFKAL